MRLSDKPLAVVNEQKRPSPFTAAAADRMLTFLLNAKRRLESAGVDLRKRHPADKLPISG